MFFKKRLDKAMDFVKEVAEASGGTMDVESINVHVTEKGSMAEIKLINIIIESRRNNGKTE